MNNLPIISAEQRMAEQHGIKAVVAGGPGIGKTSLLLTLAAEVTLFMDMEAGDLAVEGWPGDTIRPKTWQECRDFAVFIGGPNPALRDDQSFSQAHFNAVCAKYGDPSVLNKYETIFIDSITVAGRLCFQWCKGQPQAVSEKTDKPDLRGAYGLHGQEMIAWLTHLQHTRGKNIIFVGILDQKMDDFNRKFYTLQIEGSKTGLELPGIVDEVITMAELRTEDNQPYRTFVCQTLNQWGYPAKDRSGRLNLLETPHLGNLMKKIKTPAKPAAERLDFGRPGQVAESAPAAGAPSTTQNS